MLTVTLNDFTLDTLKYINLVRNGEKITISDEKFPIIILQQKKINKRRALGLGKGDFKTPDDFNEDLPENIISSFECK